MEPVIKDQDTAARVYFVSAVRLLFLKSLLRLPLYLISLFILLRYNGRLHVYSSTDKPSWPPTPEDIVGSSNPFTRKTNSS